MDLQLDTSLNGRSLPSFALQLLVENCIKHNVISLQRPLTIRIFHEDDQSVSVSNNLQPKKAALSSNGVGLENLKSRYALMGVDDGLAIQQTAQAFTVSVRLVAL